MANYITTRKGRRGYYFSRHVPKELRAEVGKHCWLRFAGATLGEARGNVPRFLAETDVILKKARETLGIAPPPVSAEGRVRFFVERGESADYDLHDFITTDLRIDERLDDKGTENPEFARLYDLGKAHQQGQKALSMEELLAHAITLKNPAVDTKRQWTRYLKEVLEFAGKDYLTDITKEDAKAYRKWQLEKNSANSTKTRLRYLRGLFELAKDEEWLSENVFDGLTKHIKVEFKRKQEVSLAHADAHWCELPERQQLLWNLARWTGAHISEVGALRPMDLDLERKTVNFPSIDQRPLKNNYRERTIPMHPQLQKMLRTAPEMKDRAQDEYLFPWNYSEAQERWGEGLSQWKRVVGHTPKATRDYVAQRLRTKGVNEEVIGFLLGHNVKSITGMYGTAEWSALEDAINLLD